MQKLMMILLVTAVTSFDTACVASRKFVRNEVKTSSDALNARIDTNDGEIKEVRDGVTRVDERVGRIDAKTAEHGRRLDGLKGDVQMLDQKAADAQNAADRVAGEVTLLDQKFQNRNHYVISAEKSVYFNFNSAQLDSSDETVLDEVAETLQQNPDALVVLEGRTDSRGNDEYNIKLGERRSEAVKRYLVVEKGVPVYKLHQISFGAARPVADNKSREGREKNRAVMMLILVPRTESATASQ